MKKQILVLVLFLLPLIVLADAFPIKNDDGITIFYRFYNLNGNEELEVANVPASTVGRVNIPETINYQNRTIKVTTIGWDAFRNCSMVTSIGIPKTIKYMDNAFEGCSGLTGVYISDLEAWCNITFYANGLSSNPLLYAHHLFLNNEEIQDLVIPNSVTEVKAFAFMGCSGLKNVTFPNYVNRIGYMAFYHCTGLMSAILSENITEIDTYAFGGASNLADIQFSNKLVKIDVDAFGGTAWYNKQPDGLVYAGNIAYKYKGQMSDDTKIVLKDGTLGISGSAFYGCKGMTSILIPNSVAYIGGSAFSGCSGLTSLVVPKNVSFVGEGVIANCSGLTSIDVENGNSNYNSDNKCNAIIETVKGILIGGCKNTIIPEGTTELDSRAFQGCLGLSEIIIPDRVSKIGYAAFDGCTNLSSVKFGRSIAYIGGSAFENCKNLVSVELPNSITQIDYRAFNCCSNLLSVTIGSNCLNIGSAAFSCCPKLTEVFCMASMSPSAQTDTFEGSNINNATLYVPSGSTNDYTNYEPWNKFGRIISVSFPAAEYKLTYIVDGNLYKTFYLVEGELITPEPAPSKEGYTFSGWSEIPETMPAHDVTVTGTFTKDGLPKCATPVIDVVVGKIKLSCETEDVIFKTNVTYNSSSKSLEGEEEINLSRNITCHISVIATKEGYEDSDTVTKDVKLRAGAAGDVNSDGDVNVGDIVTVTNIMAGYDN